MLLQLSLCTLLAATSCVADQRLNSNDPLDPLSINDLAKKPSVKLDPKLRKALLKILTRLDEEDKQVDEIRQNVNQQQQILLSSTPIPTILPASKIQDTSKENIVLFPTPNSPTDELNLKVNSSKVIEKIPTELSRSQIDFFQVPLLTAFTLQQDFNGIPRSVIPIYTEPEQLERQKIQALEIKQESKKEKNSIETEKNKLETLKHTELSQQSQQTGRPLLPITTLATNLPQNSFHHHQLTIQQLEQQQVQTQFKPRYIESGLTQQSLQQPQTIQDQIIESQQILRQQPNQQQPLQNQIIQSHQNQLQFTPQQPINLPPSKLDFFPQQPAQFLFTQQQTILPQITRSQNFQLEPSKQQFFQPNVVKNQFSHTQIIPSQQYQLQQYQQIQPNSFDQQQLFQQRQIEFKPELFTQQTRILRQPQETFGYGISVPKLPDDLNVVYKVLALNHRHRNT